MATRRSASAPISRKHRVSSSSIASESALRRSGRFSVTRAVDPSRSTAMSLKLMGSLRSPSVRGGKIAPDDAGPLLIAQAGGLVSAPWGQPPGPSKEDGVDAGTWCRERDGDSPQKIAPWRTPMETFFYASGVRYDVELRPIAEAAPAVPPGGPRKWPKGLGATVM